MDRDKRILGLYLTSIIIGAGILALPLKAAKIGLIPMLALIAIFAYLFYEAYKRIIEASLGFEHVDLSTYDKILIASGMPRFGRLSLEYGMIVYVIPADVVYTLFSATRFYKLAELTRENVRFLYAEVLSLILGSVLAILFIHRSEVISKFFAFLAGRSFSILLLYVLRLSKVASLILGSVLFMLVMFLGEYFPEILLGEVRVEDERFTRSGEIHPRHYVAALYTIFKVAFVIAIAILSIVVISLYHAIPNDVNRIHTSPMLILSGIGVTAFAFVGTGVYNIVTYDRLRKGDKRKGVLFLGVMIPAITYMFFTFSITAFVDNSLLIEADKSMEPSLLALARKLETLGISISTGTLIALAGIFTLLAVSMSYLGFTDTLGGRLSKYVRYEVSRALVSVISTIIAIIIAALNPELTATGILDVAGSAGGILFLLFLPFLLIRRRIDLVFAIVALSLIPLANIPAMCSGSLVQSITAAISSVIALILGILTLYEREIHGPSRAYKFFRDDR